MMDLDIGSRHATVSIRLGNNSMRMQNLNQRGGGRSLTSEGSPTCLPAENHVDEARGSFGTSGGDGAGMPGCDAVGAGRCRDPEIARSERSASTSDRVHAGARITTEGPIAPDRPAAS